MCGDVASLRRRSDLPRLPVARHLEESEALTEPGKSGSEGRRVAPVRATDPPGSVSALSGPKTTPPSSLLQALVCVPAEWSEGQEELLLPGAEIIEAACGHRVWISTSSREMHGAGLKVLCVGCAQIEGLTADNWAMTPEQWREALS